MRVLIVPILAVVATATFSVAMYQVFTRDYQYLQLVKMGDQLLEENLPFQAAQAYGSAINLRPDKPLGYVKRAHAHQEQGDLAHALDDLLVARELSTDVIPISLRLADIYYERGQFDEAARHYSEVISLDPDPVILYRLGLSCFRGGRESEALDALNRAIEARADFPEAFYLRGAIHRSVGETSHAETDFLNCLALEPDQDEARSALIELYVDGHQPEKARQWVQQEINREPQAPSPYLHLSDIYRLLGEHGEAIGAVNLALEQAPNLPEAYLRLGELWLEEGIKQGDRVAFEKAITALDSAAKMDPSNGSAALALGRACLAIGNDDRAFVELKRAAGSTPIQAEAHQLLGDLYASRGAYTEAITAYHIYLKLKGDVPSVIEKLGDAYLSMDNPETAAATYLHLISADPNRVVPYIKAARALAANGQTKEAARVCRRGLASNPENEALQSLLSELTQSPVSAPSKGTS